MSAGVWSTPASSSATQIEGSAAVTRIIRRRPAIEASCDIGAERYLPFYCLAVGVVTVAAGVGFPVSPQGVAPQVSVPGAGAGFPVSPQGVAPQVSVPGAGAGFPVSPQGVAPQVSVPGAGAGFPVSPQGVAPQVSVPPGCSTGCPESAPLSELPSASLWCPDAAVVGGVDEELIAGAVVVTERVVSESCVSAVHAVMMSAGATMPSISPVPARHRHPLPDIRMIRTVSPSAARCRARNTQARNDPVISYRT